MFAKYDDVDTAVATLRLSEGTRAILSCTRHDPLGYDIRTELFGSRDSVSVGLGPTDAAALRRAGRAAARRPGMESLSRTVRGCVS